MNFSTDSVKAKSNLQNQDFCYDIETPRGNFFAVLDFDSHDYANLNAALKGKLETIVDSFVSLSRFSAELFLGFLAKEINNFLHNLKEQAGGPELLGSAALCLVSGNRLAYFLCGDVGISIHSSGRVLPLQPAESHTADKQSERLGGGNQEAPFSDQVQAFTLQDNDVVLIMTKGVERQFETHELSAKIGTVGSNDPKLICDTLMKSSESSAEDRTLVVVSGPYQRYVEPVLADLSKAVASLESRLSAISQDQEAKTSQAPEGDVVQQIELLKDDLKGKASRIDLLELQEKINSFSLLLASKADTAEVLGLQSEVLKLGLAANAGNTNSEVSSVYSISSENADEATKHAPESVARVGQGSFWLKAALLVLVMGFASAFLGAWLQSRRSNRAPESWSVRTAGSQILISRAGGNGGTVTLSVAQPLKTSGEQTFSSFADVQRYIETIANPALSQESPSVPSSNQSPAGVTEVSVKPGDTLRKFAQQYNVPQEKIMELNPTVTRWPAIRVGQKIIVPATTAAAPSPAQPQPSASPASSDTLEVIAQPGDSINRFAQRYRTTPERIKELNPQITNWAALQTGQKVLVPNSPAG
jgi:LysM repeat protein